MLKHKNKTLTGLLVAALVLVIAGFVILTGLTDTDAPSATTGITFTDAEAAAYEAAKAAETSTSKDNGKKIGQINPDPGHIKNASGSPALPGDSVMMVYPLAKHKPSPQTGEYRDVDNIQWALDNVQAGGKVKLMTTDPDDNERKAFYFSEPGSTAGTIDIHQSLTLEGEVLSAVSGEDWSAAGTNYDFQLPNGITMKSDRAVIYGGGYTDSAVLDIWLGSNVTITGLRFEKSGFSSIYTEGTTYQSVNIKNNVITNPQAFRQESIPIRSWYSSNVTVQNNLISGTMWNALDFPFTSNAIIKNNTIARTGSTGKAYDHHIELFKASSPLVEGNTITGDTVYKGDAISPWRATSPTIRNNTIDGDMVRYGIAFAYSTNAIIEGNTLKGSSQMISAMALAQSPVIENNDFSQFKTTGFPGWGGTNAQLFLLYVYNAEITGNKFGPQSALDFVIMASSNNIHDNDYTAVTAPPDGYVIKLRKSLNYPPPYNNSVIEPSLTCAQIDFSTAKNNTVIADGVTCTPTL